MESEMAKKKTKAKNKDKESEDEKGTSKGDGGLGKIIVIAVVAIVCSGIGAGAAVMMLGGKETTPVEVADGDAATTDGEAASSSTETVAATEANSEETKTVEADSSDEKSGDEANAGPAKPRAVYYEIKPPFVVRIKSKKYRKDYLQVTVNVMARDQKVLNEVELHAPLVKNDLDALFSAKTRSELVSMEKREQLRKEALDIINNILKEHGSGQAVEEVLFTSFVVQ